MPNESQNDQKSQETPLTEMQPNETLHRYLKRLSQSARTGSRFVNLSSLGPITIHSIGSFEKPEDTPQK